MTKKQQCRFKMYLSLRVFLRTKSAIASKLPNFDKFMSDLDAAIMQIETCSFERGRMKHQISGEKKQLRHNLIEQSKDTSCKIYAYALFYQNLELQKATNISRSTLRNASDLSLVDISKAIYRNAALNLPQLGEYFLDATSQTEFKQLIDKFEGAISTSRLNKLENNSAKRRLEEGFQKGEAAIHDLDLIVNIVQRAEPMFHFGYLNARKVISAVSRKVALVAKVWDNETGDGIVEASLKFYKQGSSVPLLSKETAKKGGCIVKSLTQGSYVVTISKIGYQSQTITIVVSSTERYLMNVKLEKIGEKR